MTMHPEATKAIERRLHALFEKLEIVDQVPKLSGMERPLHDLANEVSKHKGQWLNRQEIMTEPMKSLIIEISSAKNRGAPTSGRFLDIVGKEKATTIIDNFIAFLDSTPKSYVFHFLLPIAKGLGIEEIGISSGISICEIVGEAQGQISPGERQFGSLASVLLREYRLPLDANLRVGNVTIRVETDGYVGDSLESSATRSALSLFKQFIIFAAVSGFLKIPTAGYEAGAPWLSKVVWGVRGGKQEERKVLDMPENVLKFMSAIEIRPLPKLGPLDFWVPGETDPQQRFMKSIAFRLRHVSTALALPRCDEGGNRLRAASEWTFDSLVGDNETISFLQVAIGMEALLGEKENQARAERGVTELLADRCAYLLGGSVNNRNNVRDLFRKFYDIRSKIVHGREPRLSQEDSHFLYEGRRLLSQAILKELEYVQ